MDVCSAVENNCEMEGETLNDVNYKCFPTDDFILSSGSIHHVEINNSGESTTDDVSGIDTNSCYPIDVVPSNLSASEVDAITKSVCEEYTDCEDKTYIVPDSPPNSLFSKVNPSFNNTTEEVNNFDSGICEDSNSRCDVLSTVGSNAEEVLPELSETCSLGSVERSSCINITCERKPFLEDDIELSETTFTDSHGMCTSDDVLSIKEEAELVNSNNLQSKGSEFSIENPCRESHRIVENNDSVTTCADEEENNCTSKTKDPKGVNEMVLSVREDNPTRESSSHSSVTARKSLNNVAGTGSAVLYQCINCSFTHAQLEKLSSHVLTCPKKRRREQILVSGIEEPTPKARLLEQQHLVLPTEYTTSKSQSVVLSRTQVPGTPKTQFIITPQSQFLTSPHLRIGTAPNTQVHSSQPAQFMLPSSAQQTAVNKTVLAIAPKLVSTSKKESPCLVNPQTQRYVSLQPQVSIQKQQNRVLKPQISVSPQTRLSSPLRAQPVITLQTQLPIVSNTQLSSVSQSQIVTSSPIPLASGTKVTLGPHSQVPVIPQAPLTLPHQGLTIAQAGTQLFITTKPVQQSAGAPNQPTLLGLGIGTNPAVAPKNIVLLPNVLLNSIAPSAGKVNSKQASTIQRQLILQTTPATSSSVAPVQLQKTNVNIPLSTKNQSPVLMSPLYTVCSNPFSTSGSKTTVSSTVQKPKLLFSSLTSNSRTKTAPASTTNTKPVEVSNKVNVSVNKFICEICDDTVKDLKKLRSHMKCLHEINIHPKVIPSFSCQKCQFSFFTEQGLERHLVGSHGLVTPGLQEAADQGKDGGRCPICGWGYQNKLLDHVATEHKVCLKPVDLTYKCTICSATFGMYKRFEDHVYSVHRPALSKLPQEKSKSSSSSMK